MAWRLGGRCYVGSRCLALFIWQRQCCICEPQRPSFAIISQTFSIGFRSRDHAGWSKRVTLFSHRKSIVRRALWTELLKNQVIATHPQAWPAWGWINDGLGRHILGALHRPSCAVSSMLVGTRRKSSDPLSDPMLMQRALGSFWYMSSCGFARVRFKWYLVS